MRKSCVLSDRAGKDNARAYNMEKSKLARSMACDVDSGVVYFIIRIAL